MTLAEIIEQIDVLVPNNLSDRLKVMFLNNFQRELFRDYEVPNTVSGFNTVIGQQFYTMPADCDEDQIIKVVIDDEDIPFQAISSTERVTWLFWTIIQGMLVLSLAPTVPQFMAIHYHPRPLILTATSVVDPTTAATLTNTGAGSTLPTSTYYVQYSWANANGQTLVSAEASQAITLGQPLGITVPALQTGATSTNIFVSSASTTETLQMNTISSTVYITAPLVAGAAKPITNTTSTDMASSPTFPVDYHHLLVYGVGKMVAMSLTTPDTAKAGFCDTEYSRLAEKAHRELTKQRSKTVRLARSWA